MPLTDTEIDALLKQQSISDQWPWSTNDERIIDKNTKDIVAEICRKARVKDRTEYGHYGSGYASFVDCWLYRSDDEFRYSPGNNFHGLVLLFSRLSPFYVMGQGNKSWNKTGGASYLPEFNFVDHIEHRSLMALVPRITAVLDERGLKRLHKSEMATILPTDVLVPTIMAERVFRHFDALFYWED